MNDYFKRLGVHPGVPTATGLTFMFAVIAGPSAMLASIPFWIIVLISARTQPLPEDDL